MHRLTLLTAIAGCLCSAPSFAHNPLEGSTVFSAPVPGDALAGAITFATLIGPPSGMTIMHATLDVTFRPSGTTTAQEVELTFAISVDGVSRHWTVSGADLGWGTGSGRFSGRIDTDALFGQVDGGLVPGTSTISLTMRSTSGGGLSGRFSKSSLDLTLCGSLRHDGAELSAPAGGTQHLSLDAGGGHAGETYLVVGSMSGTTPGTALGPLTLPLNFDAYTVFTASNPNQLIVSSLGTLDASGRAGAQVVLPPGAATALIGLEAHHAYVTVGGAGGIRLASNPSTLRFGS